MKPSEVTVPDRFMELHELEEEEDADGGGGTEGGA